MARSPLARLGRAGRVVGPSLVAGLLVAFSVPPWAFWPLALPGVALFAWSLSGLRARARGVAGMVFGFGLFGPTLFWISEFHAVGYVALLVLEGSFFAVAAVATPPRRLAGLVALPATYVLAEVARGVVPFGGLPMGGLPLGQAGGSALSPAGSEPHAGDACHARRDGAAGMQATTDTAAGRTNGPDAQSAGKTP